MKTISVGELRQNPTAALVEAEHGERYIVTRREVALFSSVARRRAAPSADCLAMLDATPLDDTWHEEVVSDRAGFGEERDHEDA